MPILICAQNSLKGPIGLDATYYYIDKDRREWVGTGSSGGIFLKANDSSWISVNKPFGPAHVSWIGEYDGILYVCCDSNYYKFNFKKQIWLKVNRYDKIVELKKIELESKLKQFDFIINRYKDSSLHIPKRLNYLFLKDSNEIIYCTQSGLYKFNNSTDSFYKIKNNIIASDVSKIETLKNNELFCITQDDRVWKYFNGNWTLESDLSNLNVEDIKIINKQYLNEEVFKKQKYRKFTKRRSFTVTSKGIVQSIDNKLYYKAFYEKEHRLIISLSYFDIFDIQNKSDTILVLGNVNSLNNYYTFDCIKLDISGKIIDKITMKSKNISYIKSNNYKLYPEIINEIEQNRKLKYGKNYYFSKNKINSKILCINFSNSNIYYGTYGSGIIIKSK
jgi:hypothetical protein